MSAPNKAVEIARALLKAGAEADALADMRGIMVAPALTRLWWAGDLHGASSAGRNGEAKIVQLDDGGDDAQSEP